MYMYSIIICSMNIYDLFKKKCSFKITKTRPILCDNKTGK